MFADHLCSTVIFPFHYHNATTEFELCHLSFDALVTVLLFLHCLFASSSSSKYHLLMTFLSSLINCRKPIKPLSVSVDPNSGGGGSVTVTWQVSKPYPVYILDCVSTNGGKEQQRKVSKTSYTFRRNVRITTLTSIVMYDQNPFEIIPEQLAICRH